LTGYDIEVGGSPMRTVIERITSTNLVPGSSARPSTGAKRDRPSDMLNLLVEI
jgi:hypothetical protein